jgi:hypothetical protein
MKTGERMQAACARQVFVLFHPDYDRRPRDHTGSADLDEQASAKRSRARCNNVGNNVVTALPPVGIFTPPREHREQKIRINCKVFRHAGIYHG